MIKDIKNYENVYQIDELGNVISKLTNLLI